MPGPPPTPTRLKLLRGNPGRRPLPVDEPQPDTLLALPVPADLEPAAAVVWEELTGELASLGMLTRLDGHLLKRYCITLANLERYDAKLRQFGEIIKAPKNDYPIQSPYVSMAAKAQTALLRMQQELGLTPAARSRVKTVYGQKKTRLQTFAEKRPLKQGRA